MMIRCKQVLFFSLILLLSSCALLQQTTQQAIVRGDLDQREYRLFQLENRLSVLVISDLDTQKSTAAMDVAVGSSADPKGRDGLAHFLEHMLFLGTEKYPDSGEYQSYIDRHGGRHNAYTAFEHTNYFFDIEPDYLEPALDRFAQFFIAPLFTEKYVEREKNAVNSEYRAGYKNDYRRSLDALREVVNPQSPFVKFSVGSLETLSNGETAIRDELTSFYRQHYSSNTMRLVVLGKQSVDELENMVRGHFSTVPDRNLSLSNIDQPLFNEDVLPARLSIVPEKELRQLSVLFPMPSLQELWREKPMAYISNLVGHEGEGSLLSELKRRGWAESLSAGQSLNYRGGATYEVSITLSEKGLAHTEDVIKILYQMLNTIRQNGLQAWRYEEQSRLAQLQFRFQEKGEPFHYASRLAHDMHYYDETNLLRGSSMMTGFDRDMIESFLDYLKPENSLVKLFSKTVQTDSQSHWYQTPYKMEPVSAETLSQWQKAGLNAELKLPNENPFVPQELTVLPAQSLANPELIIDESLFQLWHHENDRFQVPRSGLFFSVRTPLASDTAKHAALAQLYVALLRDRLNEFTYPAALAGLHFGIRKHPRGFSVRISGYSEKQERLLERLLRQLRQTDFEPARFNSLKKELLRSWRNAERVPPYKRLFREVSAVLFMPHWSEEDLITAIEDQELQDLQMYMQEFWSAVSIVSLVNGNTSRERAEAAAEQLKALLSDAPKKQLPSLTAVKLSAGDRLMQQIETEHQDAAQLLYVQGSDNGVEDQALLALSAQIVGTPFYQQIRTEQQLGYIVSANYMPVLTVPGIAFVVQSPSHDESMIYQAVEQFLADFSAKVGGITQEQFDQHKQAVINDLLEAPKNLHQQTEQFWRAIALHDATFDRKAKIAAHVDAISLADFQSAYQQYFQSEKNRMLLLQTQADDVKMKSLEVFNKIEDIKQFKSLRPKYKYP